MSEATIQVLATRGFAAATARAIAEEAGCNSALVFYHHGTLNDLLLEALDRSNHHSLERYQEAVDGAEGVRDLLGAELLATLAGDHRRNRATLQRLTEKRGVLRRLLTTS